MFSVSITTVVPQANDEESLGRMSSSSSISQAVERLSNVSSICAGCGLIPSAMFPVNLGVCLRFPG